MVPSPYTEKDGKEYLKNISRFREETGQQREWAVRKDGNLIGGIGLMYNFGLDAHKSEFGYWIGAPYRGKGLMTHCVRAFAASVFEFGRIARLEAHVFVHNPASSRVLEKSGFQREGLVRRAFLKDGEFLDAYLYARLSGLDPDS